MCHHELDEVSIVMVKCRSLIVHPDSVQNWNACMVGGLGQGT